MSILAAESSSNTSQRHKDSNFLEPDNVHVLRTHNMDPSSCLIAGGSNRISLIHHILRCCAPGYRVMGYGGSTTGAGSGHENGVLEGRLDRLPEGSIPLLCRLLNIAPYGPSPYLKFRLRSTLAALSSEDVYFTDSKTSTSAEPKVSSADSISQLSLSELRTVLGRRGFPTTPLTLPQLRENLQWWLAQKEHPVERRLEAVLELARWSHRERAILGGQARI